MHYDATEKIIHTKQIKIVFDALQPELFPVINNRELAIIAIC